MKTVGEEQVPCVVARIDPVQFEASNDVAPGRHDLDEELIDVNHGDSMTVTRDVVVQTIVEIGDRAPISIGQGW